VAAPAGRARYARR
jgi:hypothetical protein